uniref:Fatty acid desaturase domain-containing protein n=2 Tax=Lutzomyia longipalpis TaxID=7200 RepID=A0A1B0CQM8_LUTLO
MIGEVSREVEAHNANSVQDDDVKKLDELDKSAKEIGTDFNYTHKIKWMNVTLYIVYHITAFIGLYLFFALQVHPLTMIHSALLVPICGFGGSIGAHRYYTHRAFKATALMRGILLMLFTMSGQNTMWAWVRNHRQHHKYCDTDADPHNARRGLFFSHMGWFLTQKHPTVIKYGRQIDMRDLDADPLILCTTVHFIGHCVPKSTCGMRIPLKSFLVGYVARTCVALNLKCSINSFAHAFGAKPYDKSILPGENKFISFFTMGEAWHNYHHAFPWDYRTSELGMPFTLSTTMIDLCVKLGLIYDLKVASEDSIKKRILKTGDKSHE